MRKKDIISRLQGLADDVDSDLYGKGPFRLTIVGSSALICQGAVGDERATRDIDLVQVPEEILPYLARFDMNNAADTFLYTLASGWKDRCADVSIHSRNVFVKALSIEDAAIAKLSAARDLDMGDIEAMSELGSIDWQKTRAILENPLEMQVSLAEEAWSELKDRFEKASGLELREGRWDVPDNL